VRVHTQTRATYIKINHTMRSKTELFICGKVFVRNTPHKLFAVAAIAYTKSVPMSECS